MQRKTRKESFGIIKNSPLMVGRDIHSVKYSNWMENNEPLNGWVSEELITIIKARMLIKIKVLLFLCGWNWIGIVSLLVNYLYF